MNELRRLYPGMSVSDIGNRPVGQVAEIRDDGFVLATANEKLALHPDALFVVGRSGAWLVCNERNLDPYIVRPMG